jgi:hypothetical protein
VVCCAQICPYAGRRIDHERVIDKKRARLRSVKGQARRALPGRYDVALRLVQYEVALLGACKTSKGIALYVMHPKRQRSSIHSLRSATDPRQLEFLISSIPRKT